MSEFDAEQARAEEYRRKMRQRNVNALAAESNLRGSFDALHELRLKTSALRKWPGWDPENEGERPEKSP